MHTPAEGSQSPRYEHLASSLVPLVEMNRALDPERGGEGVSSEGGKERGGEGVSSEGGG